VSETTTKRRILNILARLTLPVVAGGSIACGGPLGPDANSDDTLAIVGRGTITDRVTTELTVAGDYAYVGTSSLAALGNATVMIFNTAGASPVIVDSLKIPDAARISDIQAADNGKLLVVSTEPVPGSIVVYDLTDRAKPALLSRFTNANTSSGVHTAEVQRVNGRLYAFLSTDNRAEDRSKLVIVDITDPRAPAEVFAREMGFPFVHDVFVRDGILSTMLWNDGVEIFDIGGGGRGGTVAAPVSISKFPTVGGRAHNGWWYHEPSGQKRYLFVGEEAPGTGGAGTAAGDIHVLDVSDLSAPREVAFYSVLGAGTHNFWMDEGRGILYAAYYNGGVRAIDVRGDLSSCNTDEKGSDGRCDLGRMNREIATGLLDAGVAVFIWGVQAAGGRVYASDMLSGLWILGAAP
jgi:hypothetical protein